MKTSVCLQPTKPEAPKPDHEGTALSFYLSAWQQIAVSLATLSSGKLQQRENPVSQVDELSTVYAVARTHLNKLFDHLKDAPIAVTRDKQLMLVSKIFNLYDAELRLDDLNTNPVADTNSPRAIKFLKDSILFVECSDVAINGKVKDARMALNTFRVALVEHSQAVVEDAS